MPVQLRASSYTIPAEKPPWKNPSGKTNDRNVEKTAHRHWFRSRRILVKETIRKYLEEAGYAVDDQGTTSEESVDYPDYGKAVGERVVSKQADLGIAVCGSGIGISIAANKVPGIRAALAHDVTTARLAREHNDANVLALGGRHQRRLDKITQLERDSHLS